MKIIHCQIENSEIKDENSFCNKRQNGTPVLSIQIEVDPSFNLIKYSDQNFDQSRFPKNKICTFNDIKLPKELSKNAANQLNRTEKRRRTSLDLEEYPAIFIKRKKCIEKKLNSKKNCVLNLNAQNQFVNSEYDIEQNDSSKFEPPKSLIDNLCKNYFKLKNFISAKKNFKIFQSNNKNNIVLNLASDCDSSSNFYASDFDYSIDSLDLILNDEEINALIDKSNKRSIKKIITN